MLDQAILEFIEDQRKERIIVTENKSEGKLHCYLKDSIPMFNMNLEPQEAGLEECAAEIVKFITDLRVLVRKFQKML